VAVTGGRDGRPLWHERSGFALVETARAMVLLAIVIAGVLSAVSLAYSPGVASEGLNVARGVATFTLPFIRSRHATAADSMRIHLG